MISSFALAGCFDPPQPRIDEATWQSCFVGVNFDWRPREIDYERYPVTESEYYLDGTIYGLKKVEGQPDYHYMIDRGEEIEISSSEYIADFASRYSPLITFLHDNFAGFTRYENPANMSDEIFIYEQELPADVMTVVSYFMDIDNFATLVVSVNGANLQSVKLLDFTYDGDISAFIDNMEMNWQVDLSNFGEIRANDRLETLRYKKDFEARVETAFEALGDIDDGNMNFKVTATAEGESMEIWVNANGLRRYNYNSVGTVATLEEVLYKDGKTHTYYKNDSRSGIGWETTNISKETYNDCLEDYYEVFCGGVFLGRDSSYGLYENENVWVSSTTRELNYDGVHFEYFNIKYHIANGNTITSVTWDARTTKAGVETVYHFTLTVGQGDFTLPNV